MIWALASEGFTPQSAKPPNRSPCSNSTDTKFDNIFLRIELWILYVSKRLVTESIVEICLVGEFQSSAIFRCLRP